MFLEQKTEGEVLDVLVRPYTNVKRTEEYTNETISKYFASNWFESLKKNQNYFERVYPKLVEKPNYPEMFMSKYHFHEDQTSIKIFEAFNQFNKIDLFKYDAISTQYLRKRTDQLFLYLKYCDEMKQEPKMLNGGLFGMKMIHPKYLDYTIEDYSFESKQKLKIQDDQSNRTFIGQKQNGKKGIDRN